MQLNLRAGEAGEGNDIIRRQKNSVSHPEWLLHEPIKQKLQVHLYINQYHQ